MLICRNAKGVLDQRKFDNPYLRGSEKMVWLTYEPRPAAHGLEEYKSAKCPELHHTERTCNAFHKWSEKNAKHDSGIPSRRTFPNRFYGAFRCPERIVALSHGRRLYVAPRDFRLSQSQSHADLLLRNPGRLTCLALIGSLLFKPEHSVLTTVLCRFPSGANRLWNKQDQAS